MTEAEDGVANDARPPTEPDSSNGAAPVTGVVRLVSRTAESSPNFSKGDIVIVDVADLDRNLANTILVKKPAAILNARQSVTGRGPSLGAMELINAGIPVVDDLGAELLDLHEGEKIQVLGADVLRDGTLIASGSLRTKSDVEADVERGRQRLGSRIRSYSMAVAQHFEDEEDLVLTGAGLPDLSVVLRGRTALVISAVPQGVSVRALRRLVNDQNAVVVAVGLTGLAAAKSIHRRVDVVVGIEDASDIDSVREAKAVVLLARPDGSTRGATALRSHAVDYSSIRTSLGELEVGLLLAGWSGARIIIEVSRTADLESMVDAGGTTFNGAMLARAQFQDRIVGAAAALRIGRPTVSNWLLVLMFLMAVLAIVAAILLTPWGDSLLAQWRHSHATGLSLEVPSFAVVEWASPHSGENFANWYTIRQV